MESGGRINLGSKRPRLPSEEEGDEVEVEVDEGEEDEVEEEEEEEEEEYDKPEIDDVEGEPDEDQGAGRLSCFESRSFMDTSWSSDTGDELDDELGDAIDKLAGEDPAFRDLSSSSDIAVGDALL
jgi:hypothetical protein